MSAEVFPANLVKESRFFHGMHWLLINMGEDHNDSLAGTAVI